ncbi:AAA family ATPase [Methylocystis sp. ATCC 49242]|uniref:bifunctional aminoglycoside phosphotransferase/ATP-binding protein n=1 Tax=Methylocystis sp. ATCC 49242 TaxID=622637 RepID=UPI0001F87FE0|nr:AAA family ATPase [Methylocystis sp. ATCC 49242]
MSTNAQDETVRFLSTLDGGAQETVTTHISIVLLGKERVYKLKRAVRFPYLDFSTPRLRLEMCEREVALNRRYAPRLYLGARRVTREKDGSLALDGAGETIDAVVVMRRFDDDALFEKMALAGRLTRDMIERLARHVAQVQDAEPPDYVRGGVAALGRIVDNIDASLREASAAAPAEIDAHVARLRGPLEAQAARLDARRIAGKVRPCHGDLNLRNICLFEGEPTPFDCLEFSDDISTIDVLYDFAFLLMDLWRVDLRDLANVALNRYLDARDEIDGLPLLPFFMSMRASIRAHVEASQGHAEKSRLYLNLARELLAPSHGAIVAIGGFSGSGKSSVAAALAPRLGAAPGARTINSDRIRKRMFGVGPTERLPQQAYGSDVSARVYRDMFTAAARVAATGWPVIVDAVLDRPQDRGEIENIARGLGVPFSGVWLDVDLARRVARVENRFNDVSDATRDVLQAQMAKDTGEIGWLRIDAARDIAAIVGAICSSLPSVLARG